MSFADALAEDRRLALLRLLAESPGYAANTHLLQCALEACGHVCSMDTCAGDVAWLDEQGLVRGETIRDITLATLTGRGLDVAAGRARHPGVKRPLPGR